MFLLRAPALQQVEFAGVVPASGTFSVPFTVPNLAPGVEGRTVYLQSLFQDPTTRRWISGSVGLVVLDPQF